MNKKDWNEIIDAFDEKIKLWNKNPRTDYSNGMVDGLKSARAVLVSKWYY